MKKILIMIMSCEKDFYKTQEQYIRNTWLDDVISDKYPNIDYCIYAGSEDLQKHKYSKDTHRLLIRCEDDLLNTFKKTLYAFKLCNKLFKYDYIFRTNTSTYVNIELLNRFVQQLDNDDIVWSSELISLSNTAVPNPLDIYGRGNGLLISKKMIDIIIKEGIAFTYSLTIDDITIGNILNSYHIKNGENYLDYIKNFTHRWYKAVNIETVGNHQLSNYGDSDISWDHVKPFITIQVKSYHVVDDEQLKNIQIKFKELHQVFYENKYNDDELNEEIEKILNYSKNPSIFIGSLIGHLNYSDWSSIPKMQLFEYEVAHKAIDDVEALKPEKKKWF